MRTTPLPLPPRCASANGSRTRVSRSSRWVRRRRRRRCASASPSVRTRRCSSAAASLPGRTPLPRASVSPPPSDCSVSARRTLSSAAAPPRTARPHRSVPSSRKSSAYRRRRRSRRSSAAPTASGPAVRATGKRCALRCRRPACSLAHGSSPRHGRRRSAAWWRALKSRFAASARRSLASHRRRWLPDPDQRDLSASAAPRGRAARGQRERDLCPACRNFVRAGTSRKGA